MTNVSEARLRWLEYVERKTEEDVVMRTRKVEVGGHRKIERPTLRRSDVTREDTKEKGVKIKEAQARRTLRLKTRPQIGKRLKMCMSV